MPIGDDSRAPHDAAPGGEEPIRGAGGVVFDRLGRVLVLRDEGGSWLFPKGHVEPGETPLQAALREVNEEAGVNATCTDPTRSWTTTYRNPRGELREITWFACRTDDDTLNLTEDIFLEGAFLPPAEALERLSHEPDRRMLAQLLSDTGETRAISDPGRDAADGTERTIDPDEDRERR